MSSNGGEGELQTVSAEFEVCLTVNQFNKCHVSHVPRSASARSLAGIHSLLLMVLKTRRFSTCARSPSLWSFS
jgi:hypothetical protein